VGGASIEFWRNYCSKPHQNDKNKNTHYLLKYMQKKELIFLNNSADE
jgi:hypothetical protein